MDSIISLFSCASSKTPVGNEDIDTVEATADIVAADRCLNGEIGNASFSEESECSSSAASTESSIDGAYASYETAVENEDINTVEHTAVNVAPDLCLNGEIGDDSSSEDNELETSSAAPTESSSDDSMSGSCNESSVSTASSVHPETAAEIDKLVMDGNWNGIAAVTAMFATGTEDNISETSFFSSSSRKSTKNGNGIMSESLNCSNTSSSPTIFSASSTVTSYASESIEEKQQQQQQIVSHREEIEALFRRVMPDEIDNIDDIMAQFSGREQELIETLHATQEDSISQRAEVAVKQRLSEKPFIPSLSGGSSGDLSKVKNDTSISSSVLSAKSSSSEKSITQKIAENIDHRLRYSAKSVDESSPGESLRVSAQSNESSIDDNSITNEFFGSSGDLDISSKESSIDGSSVSSGYSDSSSTSGSSLSFSNNALSE